jgi:NADH-quinone oxidoreductase subunit A
MLNQYVPVMMMLVLAAGTGVAILVANYFLGPKKSFDEKDEPFECGEKQIVSPKQRFSVRFYLVAMIFIVFDIEAVFLFPWAVLFKPLGLFGFVEMFIFILILTIGLIYVWRKGVLEWE